MMTVIISTVIPTTVLHQALHCGYMPGTLLCTRHSFPYFTVILSIIKTRKQRLRGLRLSKDTELARGLARIQLAV